MNAKDSANLLDSPLASKLGPYRARFYDEEAAWKSSELRSARLSTVPLGGALKREREIARG